MVNLQTIGFDVLTEQEKNDFKKIYEEYSNRISQKIKNIEQIKIHLKEHNYKEEIKDKKKKIVIKIFIKIPGRDIEAEAFDWDFKRVLHKAFKRIEQRIGK